MRTYKGTCLTGSHAHDGQHEYTHACIDWRKDPETLAEWERELLEAKPAVSLCKKEHVIDMPETSVKITFPDGSSASLGLSVIEGASLLALIQREFGVKMALRNENGFSLA